MRKKTRNKGGDASSHGFDHLATGDDFYTGSPSEKPLYDTSPSSGERVRKTGRHQAVGTREQAKIDPREKMALIAILRLAAMIILLMIAFFLLKKGIGIYEESVWMEQAAVLEPSPVLRNVAVMGDLDIRATDSGVQFSDRIHSWQEADRLVRSAEGLLARNIYDQAIEQ